MEGRNNFIAVFPSIYELTSCKHPLNANPSQCIVHIHVNHSFNPVLPTQTLIWGAQNCLTQERKFLPPNTKYLAGVSTLRFWNFRGNPLARDELRMTKTVIKLRFWNFRGNPLARNEVRVSKIEVKLHFRSSAATLSTVKN